MRRYAEGSDEWVAQRLAGDSTMGLPGVASLLTKCRDRNKARWNHMGPREAFESGNENYENFWVDLSRDALRIASEELR